MFGRTKNIVLVRPVPIQNRLYQKLKAFYAFLRDPIVDSSSPKDISKKLRLKVAAYNPLVMKKVCHTV